MAMVCSTTMPTSARASLFSAMAKSVMPRSEQQQEAAEPGLPPPPPPWRGPRRLRWQWSKGDGPGEYGGPPLDFRVRKYWGDAIADPITSSDDFIWKKEWRSHVPSLDEDPPSTPPDPQNQPERGFLSLNRAFALNSIETDLTKELVTPQKSVLALQVEALREGQFAEESAQQGKPRWRMAPTRREQKQWERARKAMATAVPIADSEANLNPGNNIKDVLGISTENYTKLKGDLQILTAIFGVVGLTLCYFSYSDEVAVSYGIGLLGALTYVRMLGNSVDSLGQTNKKGFFRAAIGQPRLLVPVVLVMLFNRWNEVIVPEYNMFHLQLIPLLVGFFTYKAATVVEVFRDLKNGS